jgi:hypothetical protein
MATADPMTGTVAWDGRDLLSVTAKSQLWDLAGSAVMGRQLSLKVPVVMNYHLDRPEFLSQPADLKIELLPTTVPLTKGAILRHRWMGRVTTPLFALSSLPLTDLHMGLEGQMSEPLVIANLEAKAGTGILRLHGEATGDLPNARLVATVEGHGISVASIAPWIGTTADISLTVNSSPTAQTGTLHLMSETVMADFKMEEKNGVLRLTQPAKIGLTVVPGSPWVQPFVLKKAAKGEAVLSKLFMPVASHLYRFPIPSSDITQWTIEGDVSIDELVFVDPRSSHETSLDRLTAHVTKGGAGTPLAFDVNGTMGSRGKLAGTGSINVADQAADLQMTIDQFPSTLFDFFFPGDRNFTQILGEAFDAKISLHVANRSGPFSLLLQSPSSRISCRGALTNGVVTLTDPLYAQVAITPALSRLILKDVSPLSISAVRAESPLTLQVGHDGFSFPLFPLNIGEIEIPSIHLELGKLYCHNEGNLSMTLSLLKLSQLSHQEELAVWFAPIDATVRHGVIGCERTELLVADTYQICTWGKIDLPRDYVDMTLGLTASCLEQALGIRNLPESYVLQIPMRGPLSNVSLDTTAATAKVSMLVLWQQRDLAGAIGGKGGKILGDLAGQLGKIPDLDASAPPPKRPFPWEKGDRKVEKRKTADHEPRKKKKKFKPEEAPLKQLLKVLR